MSFKDILSGAQVALLFSGAEPMVNFGKGHNEEQFCDFILNLDQCFRSKCCLKDFLSGTLAALLFRGGDPFMQI